MSAHGKRWRLSEPPPSEFLTQQACSDVVATLLYNRLQRHMQTNREAVHLFPQVVQAFLEDDYPGALHNPMLLKGMPEASARIARAIVAQEPMVVYGDFDTDGVTAVALLMQAIPSVGGTIRPYIPHRDREGYGLNREAIAALAAEGTRLLITVDCGISNLDEVQYANELGMDVIVTDHHRPLSELPPALAVVNPKQADCTYPYDQLVGVGLAFKLVQALHRQGMHFPLRARDMLDVVALGTVADMAPLDGENRVLVKAGLEALRLTERPGLKALLQVTGADQQHVTAATIGFGLAPRINAAGRLDDAALAYDLLLADDLVTAQHLARELNRKNQERRELTRQVQAEAYQYAEQTGKHQQRIVILDSDNYPAGIVGLVAGKLVEQWGRPVILLARGAETSRGSARSIPEFNIFQALSTCQDLFDRFGGHSMAAGFTLTHEHLPEFMRRMHKLADEQLIDEMLQPSLCIDTEIALSDLNWNLYDDLAQLEPFGQGNAQPILMSRAVQVLSARSIGADSKHLKFVLAQNGRGKPLEAIAFGLGHLAEPLLRHPWIDIAYTLEINRWNGTQSLQLNVKDFRRTRSSLS